MIVLYDPNRYLTAAGMRDAYRRRIGRAPDRIITPEMFGGPWWFAGYLTPAASAALPNPPPLSSLPYSDPPNGPGTQLYQEALNMPEAQPIRRRLLIHPQTYNRELLFAVAAEFPPLTVTTSFDDALAGYGQAGITIELWVVNFPDWPFNFQTFIGLNYPGIHLHLMDTSSAGLRHWLEYNPVAGPWPLISPPTAPEPPPPIPHSTAFGLHLRAGGLDHNSPSFIADLDMLKTAKINAAKFTLGSTLESLGYLLVAGCDRDLMTVNLRGAGSDPNLYSPVQFVGWFVDWLLTLKSNGVRHVEIHNEPNWVEEWARTPSEFNAWFLEVYSQIKAIYSEALIGFPGLSPRDNVSTWLDLCAPAYRRADWIGAHCYFVSGDLLTHPEHGGYWKRYANYFPGKPIRVTEFSNPALLSATLTKADKGRQYVEYLKTLAWSPVEVAYCFISQAPSGYEHETWLGSDISGIVGAR